MAKCENTECEKKFNGITKTLYGAEGTGGLVKCIMEKISRKGTITFCLSLLSIMVVFTIYGLNVRATDADKIKKNETNIQLIQKDISQINEAISELKKQMKKQDQNLRTTIKDEFIDLQQTIKAAIQARKDLEEYNRNK